MKYTVVWKPEADARLIETWLKSDSRQLIADAANEIEANLRRHPESVGESRDGQIRVLFAPPLAVEYRVYADDRRVNVIAVWLILPPTNKGSE